MRTGQQMATEKLQEAGIPGIRYLDQGSRSVTPLADLKARLASEQAGLAEFSSPKHQANWVSGPEAYGKFLDTYRQSIADLQQQIAGHTPPTSNYVVFDPKIVDIMKKYGIAGAAPAMGALAAQDQYSPQE
jgi:hypothetical protein